ncbi:MAG: Type 1 glutamine amidotransferase-like domain-containing protein [Planctomycetota bacterium]
MAPEVGAQSYNYYLTGSGADASASTQGGVLLAGGGSDVDAAMARFNDWAGGGDVLVLRASGSDGYNDYLFDEVGGAQPDSVETIVFRNSSASSNAFVLNKIANAEAIFLAGGNQANYFDDWLGTPVQTLLNAHAAAGKPIGGTSAGLAVLGSSAFAAYNGSVTSSQMLQNPYNFDATLEHGFLDVPYLGGAITDSHFVERDRQGRMLGFLARSMADLGLGSFRGVGVEEATAITIEPNGLGQVRGGNDAEAWLLQATEPASQIAPGQTLTLDNVQAIRVSRGGYFDFDAWAPVSGYSEQGWSAAGGGWSAGPPIVLGPPTDFDGDGDVDANDALLMIAGLGDPAYDLDGDQDADFDDLLLMLSGPDGLGTMPGDFNLDGAVDLLDFDVLAVNFGGLASYLTGDATGDNAVDLLDFDMLAQNFGFSSPASVPEPGCLTLLAIPGLALLKRRRSGCGPRA